MKKYMEICISNLDDIEMANKYADRIELNVGLEVGGLTPSLSMVKKAIELSKIPIVVMVRPRSGDFNYTELEKKCMFDDAKIFLELGINGIVFGFLDKNKEIDIESTQKMIHLVHKYNKCAIFHRAVDDTNDYLKSIQVLYNLQIDRILTSGGYENVNKGIHNLMKIRELYKDLDILVGSGINKDNYHLFDDFSIHGTFSSLSNNESKLFGKYIVLNEDKIIKNHKGKYEKE